MLASGTYVASGGEVVRRVLQGRLEIATPLACAVAGEFPYQKEVTAGKLSVVSASPVGAVVAVSLDGLPLEQSRRYVAKMVTMAENTGQRLLPSQLAGVADYVLEDNGWPPVHTRGTPSRVATRVSLDGRPLLQIGLINGTWELLVDGSAATLWCDTADVSATVLGQSIVTGPSPGSPVDINRPGGHP